MKNDTKIICLIPLLLAFFLQETYSQVNVNDTIKKLTQRPPRVYHTNRLFTEKPVIDGKLSDACWKTGEWSGDYTQWLPNEGARPSQPTQLKILYDDKNIYVAIRAFDSIPQKIIRKAGRRDEFLGDMAGICFDSYHDHRTGFEFDVSAAGQKTDLLITNPMNADLNWNAVWYAKTAFEDSAWTAEFEIPLSQLRYSKDSVQVWGLHAWRWIDRFQQESDWELQSSTGPGMLYLFGELHGINGLPKSRRIEIMPYMLGKLKTFKGDPNNPFENKGRRWSGNIGLDAKIGLTSNLTVDLTTNPDFGQVEADPSVMNLTAFETFYDEKRPFFLEGKNIFNFDFDNSNLFYSRRIGHTPSFYPSINEHEFMNYPDNTTILGSAKLSGKTAKGLSLGILESLTSTEYAKVDSMGKRKSISVEPLTNYSIARVQQDFKQGNTVLGGIITSTNRFINAPQLKFMNRNAYTGGIDLLHQWHDKEYYLDAKLVASNIVGSHEAMTNLQQSSARYYQRPDIHYAQFDTAISRLSGYGGDIRIGKGSKGLWRYSTELIWRSPGLDFNDIGFMQMADIIKQRNSVYYFINKPVSIFRTFNISLSETNNWDFGLRYLSSNTNLSAYFELVNKWAINTSVSYTSQSLDTRILRGGSAMLIPSVWYQSLYVRTDPSKKLSCELNAELSTSGCGSAQYYSFQPGIKYTPINTLKLSTSFNYSGNRNDLQFITTANNSSEQRYILGKINQQTLGTTFRVDYNITPELSIQYYGSPFATIGNYSEFKRITNSKANNYPDRFSGLIPKLNGNTYEVSENNNGIVNYNFWNPDFDFSQFRSNLVFRWEYRPGSQFYLVWSQERTDFVQPGTKGLLDGMSVIRNISPKNIFLIKFNRWFSI
ncbi:carbohydrate binding family 9 domain-containing protein [Chitinophagaceae bacterium LB-8]|uniref:Carbohydrate binding family 9 domain-containing protein n=1 Tax=Paraflavisolibacter caeni TaxID=2982496 RepID=A0A9X2XZG8_9BACT|nr:DUF5916 domain-containing protein [Paraflavisolibacter caeni]MCU7552090.1 carbohydrate binding family 9 domain-containing protein [Paraflavisolibacter caeni]